MEEPRDVRVLIAAGVGSLAVAAATGAGMAFAYDADPARAHASVAAMPSFLRSAHAWSASLALALALVLGARMFVLGCYARGAMLAAVVSVAGLLAAFESGVVLPWDERAWEAWLHVRDGAGLVGIRLAGDPAGAPLAVVFGAHVALGVAIAALAAWAVRRSWASSQAAPRAPALALALAVALVLALALALPATHGPAPVVGLAVSRPHWPFLWLVPLQEAFDEGGLLALPLALALALAFAWRPPSSRAARVALVLVGALALALLTLLGGRA